MFELSLKGIKDKVGLENDLKNTLKSELLVETAAKKYLPMIDGSSSLTVAYCLFNAPGDVVKQVNDSLGMSISEIKMKTLQAKNVSVAIIDVIVSFDNMQLSNMQEETLRKIFAKTHGIEIKNNEGAVIATIPIEPTEQIDTNEPSENKSFSVFRRLMVIGAIAAAAYAAYYSNSTPWFATHVDGLLGKVSDWSTGLRNWFSTK